MKKIFVIAILCIFSLNLTFADEKYTLKLKDKLLINNTSEKIIKQIDQKGDAMKSKYMASINKLLKKYRNNAKIYQILVGIKTKVLSHKNLEELSKNIDIKEEMKGNYESKTNFLNLKIDMVKVKASWLGHYNDVRKQIGLNPYTYDSKLNDTAQEWADVSMDKGVISHKRNANDSYYNYNKITSRFSDRGVVCKNVYGVTNSENIGRGYYKCNDSNDCTEKLISGIKPVFDMYMAEKGKKSQTHYQSIVKKEFSKIGLGISIRSTGKNSYEYYITTHYCTELK